MRKKDKVRGNQECWGGGAMLKRMVRVGLIEKGL